MCETRAWIRFSFNNVMECTDQLKALKAGQQMALPEIGCKSNGILNLQIRTASGDGAQTVSLLLLRLPVM